MRTFASLFLVLLIAAALVIAFQERTPPSLVDDGADLLAQHERDRLAEYHGFLLADHDIDYRVVTSADAGDLSRFAVEQFAARRVGHESTSGLGLLLVVDPAQDLVRLEVAQALEGAFPDAFVAYVEHRQMVPFFAAGRVADGILATTELIIERAQGAERNLGFDAAGIAQTGGAGATAPARINAGRHTIAVLSSTPSAADRTTPEDVLKAYIDAMDRRDATPSYDVYTPGTRAMLSNWVVTPAQMDSVVRTYRKCRAEPERTDEWARYAVIRYPREQRECAPWFFERDAGGWALDLTMMQRAIRFGRSNAWRLELDELGPYRFAFSDWQFDSNGFPRVPED